MPRRDRFTWQHSPPHHCATCMRPCCRPFPSFLSPRSRSHLLPSLLSCPSCRVQRSSDTGWTPSPACVRGRTRISESSQKSRRTSLRVCRSPSSHLLRPTPTSTRPPSQRTPTLSGRGFASTCNSAPSLACPQTHLSWQRVCAFSPCMSLSRRAGSRDWSSTCHATSTTTCSTTTSATAAWTTPWKLPSPAVGTESWIYQIVSFPFRCILRCADTSAFVLRASCTSLRRCHSV